MIREPARTRFLSTLSLRRATKCSSILSQQRTISIHALLAESDAAILCAALFPHDFYPRSPCGERLGFRARFVSPKKFLSTLSLRRATGVSIGVVYPDSHFYPRSPCGERRHGPRRGRLVFHISIHALLAESDGVRYCCLAEPSFISIHALLAESDIC